MRTFQSACAAAFIAFGGVAADGHPADVVRFETADGIEIVGDFHRPEREDSPVVILLHEYRTGRAVWEPLIPKLRRAGFAVLAIDMRGHGESFKPTSMRLRYRAVRRDEELFRAMYQDVMAAYAFLADQPSVDLTRLALVGASVGCSVAIDYAARDRSVDVVVCLTPGERYLGVDSREHIKRYGQRPILLLATEEEREASVRLGELNPAATVRTAGPGRIHGTRMFAEIDGIEKQIVDFLQRHIGDGEGGPVVASVDGDRYFAVGSQEHMDTPLEKLRWFSSIEEARARGLTGPDSPAHGRLDDSAVRRGGGLPPESGPSEQEQKDSPEKPRRESPPN